MNTKENKLKANQIVFISLPKIRGKWQRKMPHERLLPLNGDVSNQQQYELQKTGIFRRAIINWNKSPACAGGVLDCFLAGKRDVWVGRDNLSYKMHC